MTEADALAWLEKLEADGQAVPVGESEGMRDRSKAATWYAQAGAALRSVFPVKHEVLRTWDGIFERAKTYDTYGLPEAEAKQPTADAHFSQAVGVVVAAASLVRDGRLRGLLDGVRAETVGEVLEQAGVLASASHVVAAAVLAGGALETHLLHLCNRHGLTWAGDGSISKYDGAIAKARNDGTVEVYKATDSKLVTAWGGMRNDAAHNPTKFDRTPDDVRRMVDGVREFVARTA